MLKSFDVRVKSRYSANFYNAFRVDTVRGVVYFHQCDARRNGQVARYFEVTIQKNGTTVVEARSAKGGRYERFGSTQCLKLALRLLEEARSEARQVSAVASAHATANKGCKVFDMAVTVALVALTIVATVMGIMGIMGGADSVSIAPNFGVAILSAYLGGNALVKGVTHNRD